MTNKIEYFFIIPLLALVFNVNLMAQGPSVGNWIISSDYESNEGYINYKLTFGNNGIGNEQNLNILSSNSYYYHPLYSSFAFTMGGYSSCSNTLDTYVTDRSNYNSNGLQDEWTDSSYDWWITNEAQIIPSPFSGPDYLLFYCVNDQDGQHHASNFRQEEITLNNGIPSFTDEGFNFEHNSGEHIASLTAFAISNPDSDGDRYIFTVAGSTVDYEFSGTNGLEKYKIADEAILKNVLLADSESNKLINGFHINDYLGFNLEMQDKNNIDDPTIAWITTPNNTTGNPKIFIYDTDNPIGNHYVIDLTSINSGCIAGIEFSPFDDEEELMYVSTQNLGLIKINWYNGGTLIQQYTPTSNIDFSHTYVQTGPDGNIYAVSDDGRRFGKVDKSPNHPFNSAAFTYPNYGKHKVYRQLPNEENGIKYYTLPENDAEMPPTYQNLLIIDNQTSQNDPSLADMTWNQDDDFLNNTLMFEYGFVLTDSVTLTIDSIKLEFNQENLAKVIIEPGSKLIINNTTLTNHHCYDDAKWAGVEVWGDPNESQQNINGDYNQGYLEITNSIIEHAQTAISLRKENSWGKYGGGIVKANNVSFLNNAKSVHFSPYKNMIVLGNDPAFEGDNQANFINCDFTINEEYLTDTYFYKHMDIVGVRGVRILSSDFKRESNLGTSDYCCAIEAYSASISVNEFNSTPSTFNGFYRAIKLNPNNTQVNYHTYIRNSEFTNNSVGVLINNSTNLVSIKDNIFHIGYNAPDQPICGTSQAYGIFLNQSNTFVIEDNEFYKYQNAPPNGDYIGVEAFNTKTANDEIFRNTFDGLTHANHATNTNWNITDGYRYEGLAYYCNLQSTNNNDLFFTWSGSSDDYIISGVQIGQGSEIRTAGNTFTQNVSGYNIYNNTSHGVGYYYDSDNTLEIPQVYTSGAAYVTIHAQTLDADCNSGGIGHRSFSSAEKQVLENEYIATENNYTNVKSLYQSLEDGGNTVALNTEVSTSWPNDMWELRAELLGLSPYLTTKVLKTAADKTEVLPESVLFEILSANPEELKKAELMDYLGNKAQPLPEYMISILQQLAAGQTAKTILQNDMAHYHREKSRTAMQMLVAFQYDEVFNYNTYRLWLNRLGGINADRKIVASFIAEGNINDALELANLFPELYGLSGITLSEHDYYIDMLELEIIMLQEKRSPIQLESSEYAMVQQIAEDSKETAGIKARGILEHFYGEHFCNCVNTSVDENKSTSTTIDLNQYAEAMGLKIKAEPNPATTWVAFNYELPIASEEAMLIIHNTQGKQIAQFKINNEYGQKVWDTRSLKSGTYIYEFVSGELRQTGKIVIIK